MGNLGSSVQNKPYKKTLHACYVGYITQAIVNNLAPLLFVIFQQQFQVSFEEIGRLSFINFGTQLLTDLFCIKFVDKMGYRRAAVLAHICCALGLVLLPVLPSVLPAPYLGLVIAVMVYAVGGGMLEVLVSPIVEAIPGDAKASSMSLLHAFYCWGQVLVVLGTTLLLEWIGGDYWRLLPLLWALVPVFNLFRFLKVPLAPIIPEGEQGLSVRHLMRSKFFWVALMLMMCAGACELTMSQWSSLFAEEGLHVPKVVGDLAGSCLFAALMGIGRTLYGVLGHRIHLKNALLLCGLLCVLCYGVTVFCASPVLSLLGCAVCGFSVSLMWPGTVSLSAGRFPRGGTALFGALAVFGDMGGAIGPWMAGIVSDWAQRSQELVGWGAAMLLSPEQVGLKCGLLVGMIFPILLVVGLLLLRKDKRRV